MLQFECPWTLRNQYYFLDFKKPPEQYALGLPRHAQMYSNISLSGCLYWYATLNSCKNLESETHLRNAQVSKASSVNKEIVKTCLIADMVKTIWSWITASGCELHYFVSARFISFWVVANFSTAERFKYLFFTAMKIHTMAHKVKKQSNFIFSSQVT